MKARDVLQETHQSITAKKGRSALTILGIAVGITAVVVMVSLITGLSSWLEDNMGLGSARVATVTCESDQYALDYDDIDFLLGANEDLEAVVPVLSETVEVDSATTGSSTGSSSTSTDSESTDSDDATSITLVGSTTDYFDLENIELSQGVLYTDESDASLVLDEGAVENIYGDSDTSVVGETIQIDGDIYKICGVAESSSAMAGVSVSMGYVSYETMVDTVTGAEEVDTLLCLASEDADVGNVAAHVEGLLASRHGVEYDEDGNQSVFTASTTESALEQLANFTLVFDALAAAIAGIALLVGGIGIMNMMLTNVTERYREIGLRKSLGARPRDITTQFLSESIALCVTGGVAGTIAGYLGAWGLAQLLVRYYPTFEGLAPSVSPVLVIVVFLVCTAIGVIFGYYPARRAAKLNPAETLRYQ